MMFGIIVAIIVIILLGIGGAAAPSNGGPNGTGCDRCKELPPYWRSLSFMQRWWMGVYFGWLWLECKIKGCQKQASAIILMFVFCKLFSIYSDIENVKEEPIPKNSKYFIVGLEPNPVTI